MKLPLRKPGNSSELTLPLSLARELRPVAAKAEALSTNVESASSSQPICRRSKYMAAELNTLCNLKATMPSDLVAWEAMKPVASESS